MATGGAVTASSTAAAEAIAAAVAKQPIIASSPAAEQFVAAVAQFAVVAQQSAQAALAPMPDTRQRPDVPLQPGMPLQHVRRLPMQAHRALLQAEADVLPAAVVDMPAANTSDLCQGITWSRGIRRRVVQCAAEQTSSAVLH
jgi:hypothetical protein